MPQYRLVVTPLCLSVCMDKDPDPVPGEDANTDPAVMYHVEAVCNGIKCLPYDMVGQFDAITIAISRYKSDTQNS